jgi:hypothetical protein
MRRFDRIRSYPWLRGLKRPSALDTFASATYFTGAVLLMMLHLCRCYTEGVLRNGVPEGAPRSGVQEGASKNGAPKKGLLGTMNVTCQEPT